MSAIKSKFEKIILDRESDGLMKEYKALIKLLSSKKDNETLEQNEYQQIFEYDISNIKNIKCYIKKQLKYFYIEFHYDINNETEYKYIYLKKEPYSFKFNDNNYIGFEKLSVFDFLYKEYQKKQFLIIPKNSGDDFNSVINFIDCDISQFEIKYDYQNREITQDKLELKNIYAEKNIYNAEDLNYNFPYYIKIEETDFNAFQYYESEERNAFIDEIISYIDYHFYVSICGPYGSGKTVTLLKLIMNKARKFFYVNLWTVSKTDVEELKKIFAYECIKFFRKNIFELNNNGVSTEELNIKEILKYINDFKDKKKIFELISNIISLLKNMKGKYVIVLDQYSSKYDDKNISIQNIISSIKNSNTKVIICSSMNNEDVKKYLSKSFDIVEEKNILTYIYTSALIRVRNDLIKNESLSFQKLLSEFGNLYLYYYLLKEKERKNKDLDEFVENEKKNIQNEIENFYFVEKKFKDKYQMIIDIIGIIYFINEKKIFFYEDLQDLIAKLPLKFLEIKRQEISVFDLKQYFIRTNNMDLQKKIESYSNKEIKDTFTKSDKKTCLFKKVNIITKTYKKKTNYNEFKNKISDDKRFNIYFLDYLFPYIQNIFTNLIYNESMAIGKLFFSKLCGQTEGGFLEYFIIEYIKDKKRFFDYTIDNFESIETIVENSYFIQNYSSRKPETKRNYEGNEKSLNITNTKKEKIKLRKKVILISHKQFTGKYYDCAFLFPLTENEEDKRFKIASCQISKKKMATQRYYKEEHELILGNVKKNIENTFDVEIVEGYFFYIFSSQELDKVSIEFCKKYGFEYVLFSPDEKQFNDKYYFDLSNSFITKNFPIQNSFSILPPEKFKTNNDNTLTFYDEIKSFQKKIENIKLSKENEKILKEFFGINEYIVLGFFKKKFNITKYGLWYDKVNKIIIYKNSSVEKRLYKEMVFNDYENTNNFVLIGLKNEILYSNYHSLLEYFTIKKDDDESNNIKKNK